MKSIWKVGEVGMLTVVYDGVKAFVVPDCAECILAEKHPDDMDECPLWKCEAKDECDPACEFYTEHWEHT